MTSTVFVFDQPLSSLNNLLFFTVFILSSPDGAAQQSLEDGQALLDEMSRPVKNAQGVDISPDFAPAVKHVNQRLEDLQVGIFD